MESWCYSVVEMYYKKLDQTGVETLAQSPASRMDTRETPANKAADTAVPWRVPGDICALAMPKTFCPQEEMVFGTDRHGLPFVTPKQTVHMRSI